MQDSDKFLRKQKRRMKLKIKNILYISIPALLLVSILSYFLLGSKSFIVGFSAGIFLGLLELIFLYFAIQKIDNVQNHKHFIRNYFLQAVFIRFPILALLFFTIVFWLKINPAGLIIGFSLSVITCGFMGLYKMRQTFAENL